MDTSDLTQATRRANDHPALENLARLGFAASGLIHILLAVITVQVAWYHAGGKNADQSGALATLAQNGLGQLLLWVVAIGFVGLGVWQLTEAIAGGSRLEASDRIKHAAKFVVYIALAWSAGKFAMGSGSSSKKQTQDMTASIMHHTGGRIVVGLVGIAVVAVGGYHVYKGWKKTFLEDLEERPGRWAEAAGRWGYIAKGVALAVVGLLFLAAAWTRRAKEASGLDGALRTLRQQPFGQWLLTLIALGLAAYGLYSFSRARHADV